MDHEQSFKENLFKFEETLNKYGYYCLNGNTFDINAKKNDQYTSIEQEYLNRFIKQKISISFIVGVNGAQFISFRMDEVLVDKSSFDVKRFLRKRNLENRLQNRFEEDQNFESFVEKYFDDLKSLFENELNDQITGKYFENHWQEQMDEFNKNYR